MGVRRFGAAIYVPFPELKLGQKKNFGFKEAIELIVRSMGMAVRE